MYSVNVKFTSVKSDTINVLHNYYRTLYNMWTIESLTLVNTFVSNDTEVNYY